MELFEGTTKEDYKPLAARMRPRNVDEYAGQEHIIGPGRLLRRAIQADRLSSLIFYGPPGTGKTTLAQVIANTTKSHFTTMNAVLSGVKELRETIAEAKERRSLYDRRTILFVDEVHRWNKSQQDALLPWVENGTVILIGATTENPFFEVNKALVSRSRIFQLKPLTEEDLRRVVHMALTDKYRGYGKLDIHIDEDALDHIIHVANGDARSLLNALELAIETTQPDENRKYRVTLEIAEQSIQEKAILYDKEGDYHFDIISAFIKSIRGSDPDATLYWMAKMIQAGENPHFIFRRMLISACEDVGLANPNAIVVVEANAAAFDRIGLPEGRFHLTHAALYLATSPKSNSCMAIFDAIDSVTKEKESDVPIHLRDASRDGKAFGHQENYLYPHAYRDHWVAQQYLPDGLQGKTFYTPSPCGYEASIKEEVEQRRELQLTAIMEKETNEILTFSPEDKGKENWLNRIEESRSRVLAEGRSRIFRNLTPVRHHRILDINGGTGFLIWEALRRVPEGGTWALVKEQRNREIIEHYAAKLPEMDRPVLLPLGIEEFPEKIAQHLGDEMLFEGIIGSNAIGRLKNKKEVFDALYARSSVGGKISLSEILPKESTRLSQIIDLLKDKKLSLYLPLLKEAEEGIFTDYENPLLNWDPETMVRWLTETGFLEPYRETGEYTEEKRISRKDIQTWFTPSEGNRNYGQLLSEKIENQELSALILSLEQKLAGKSIPWNRKILYIGGKK